MVELVEPLRLQLCLQRVERGHLVALSGNAQTLHLEGVLSAPHIEVEFALRLHLQAVDGRLALLERGEEPLVAVADVEGEQHAGDRGVCVLQREIAVPGAVDLVARHLALDPHAGEFLVV